jgi:hypothetical protein
VSGIKARFEDDCRERLHRPARNRRRRSWQATPPPPRKSASHRGPSFGPRRPVEGRSRAKRGRTSHLRRGRIAKAPRLFLGASAARSPATSLGRSTCVARLAVCHAMSSLQGLLERIVPALQNAGVPFIVAGSFASAAHGLPRSTNDLDIIIDPTPEALDSLLAELPSGHVLRRRGRRSRRFATARYVQRDRSRDRVED